MGVFIKNMLDFRHLWLLKDSGMICLLLGDSLGSLYEFVICLLDMCFSMSSGILRLVGGFQLIFMRDTLLEKTNCSSNSHVLWIDI